MYIINQKRNRIFNIDQFQQVCVMDNTIQCKSGDVLNVIATYKDADRADEVFLEILSDMRKEKAYIDMPVE